MWGWVSRRRRRNPAVFDASFFQLLLTLLTAWMDLSS